ncbi:MAG: hypothetical protein KBB55_03240 [Candidatus Buchananbacteria bacterium]|nr:hypothetical protein [Candidatus Buchananbacteria bacterium]
MNKSKGEYSIINIPLMLMDELAPEFCVDSVGQEVRFSDNKNQYVLYPLKPDVEGLKFPGALCVDTVTTGYSAKSPLMHSLYLLPRMPQADGQDNLETIGGVIFSLNGEEPIIKLTARPVAFGYHVGSEAQEQLGVVMEKGALMWLPRKLGGVILERAAELVQDPACVARRFQIVDHCEAA